MSAGGRLTFDFEGRPIEANATDTVASALLRAGIHTFSRGPKYHRPRGPFCLSGNCAQCHMRIGGEPNVPACVTPASEGLFVERQNVIGSGDTDLLRAVDFLYPEGIDHHHLMTHFKVLNAATKAIARRLAGIGELPSHVQLPVPARTMHRELVIIGAGPAGLSAARSALQGGVLPLVLEASPRAGGRVTEGFSADPSLTPTLLNEWQIELANAGAIALQSRVVGLYDEGGGHFVVARTPSGLLEITAQRVIVATGGHERPMAFECNDLPGVLGGRAALRLSRDYGVKPWKRAVVVGSHRDTLIVARGLRDAGLEVVGVVDPAGALAPEEACPHFPRSQPLRATGRDQVKGLHISLASGQETTLKCDLVAVTSTPAPSYGLAAEVGADAHFNEAHGGFVLLADENGRTGVDWLYAAGAVIGATGSIESGRRAGRAAVESLRPVAVASAR